MYICVCVHVCGRSSLFRVFNLKNYYISYVLLCGVLGPVAIEALKDPLRFNQLPWCRGYNWRRPSRYSKRPIRAP